MEPNLQSLVSNIGGPNVRYEMLEGRRHLVAPVAMICPGVLNGSAGPLYYPEDELKREPHVWNHMPIVMYHPTQNGRPISARDPDVINSRKVGVLLNTVFDNKLRSEAWIDVDRAKKIDDRVLQFLQEGKVMEVSTGVFTVNENAPGEYNGIQYNAIARNYRPDHLALLPDQIGACSVKDGAGLLQINRSELSAIAGVIANELKSFLKENAVDKKKIVTDLIAANRGWVETDREWLEGLNDDQLTKISTAPVAVVNNDPGDEDEEDERVTPPPQVFNTPQEYIANAPAGIREVLQHGLEAFEAEKASLVAEITANKANVFTAEVLKTKSLSELKGIAALARASAPAAPRLNFQGAAGFDPINNGGSKPTPLQIPTLTFDRKAV